MFQTSEAQHDLIHNMNDTEADGLPLQQLHGRQYLESFPIVCVRMCVCMCMQVYAHVCVCVCVHCTHVFLPKSALVWKLEVNINYLPL